MKTRTSQYLTVIAIVAVAVVVYAGTVFAQASSPTTPAPTNMLQQMQERFGPAAWAQRIQQMTRIHGAEFVSQMMERMGQQENCPCLNGEGAGPGMRPGMMRRSMMGQGMMQQGQNGTIGQGMTQQRPNGMNGNMMGRGMMGQGMMEQGAQGGVNQQRGPRFWNNTPAATPTTPPTE